MCIARKAKSTKLCPIVRSGILDPWIIQSRPATNCLVGLPVPLTYVHFTFCLV